MALEGFVRDVDIEELRIFRRERLVHRAVVIAVVSTRADIGFTQGEVRIASDVHCLMQPTAETLRNEASGADVAVSTYNVEFEVDAGILPNHRLYITGTVNGISFTKRLGVTGINVPRALPVALKAAAIDSEAMAGSGPPPA